jgi:hypothetical protein
MLVHDLKEHCYMLNESQSQPVMHENINNGK